jgi:hypothetical protein
MRFSGVAAANGTTLHTSKESKMTERTETSRRCGLGRFGRPALLGAGLLAIGGLGGAAVIAETRPATTMAPAVPVAIRTLSSDGIVTVRGRVAEIYGNKFVVQDNSGRALIDTGPEGDDASLVAAGQIVTVQGRFEDGFVHAAFLVAPTGKVVALGPLAGPPRGRHGPPPGAPDRGPVAPPPPPANGTPPPAPVTTATPAPNAG